MNIKKQRGKFSTKDTDWNKDKNGVPLSGWNGVCNLATNQVLRNEMRIGLHRDTLFVYILTLSSRLDI